MSATILLVEDNPLNRDMLTRRLQRRGFQVRTAEDGRQGLEQALQAPPDLILLDISLPEMDGLEVARRLRADERTAHLPIIALTAHAMKEDRDRVLAAGCDAYYTKPVDFAALLAEIRRRLEEGA